MTNTTGIQKRFSSALLRWFDQKGRKLPWRGPKPRDPYAVWVAEIMLQQTTVQAVIPYFERFLTRYPTVQSLAKAPLEDVLKIWAGLGYYSRARNLHKCAEVITGEYGGRFPENEAGLLGLPGIGPYTAAAISAIAFDAPATVVDGNVERVISRIFAVTEPLPQSKPGLKKLAAKLTPKERPGDYAEALMDLGATVCTPKSPDCPACPVNTFCQAREQGLENDFPARSPKPERPTRFGTVFWLEHGDKVLTRRRPEKGLLGGMPEFPTSDWVAKMPTLTKTQPVQAKWQEIGEVTHTFTHFHLVLKVFKGKGKGGQGTWVRTPDIFDIGLPTVMKKVAKKVLGD